MQKYNYVLTSTGFKSTNALSIKDYTFDRASHHTRVSFTQKVLKNSRNSFSQITFETDDIPLVLPKDKKVMAFDVKSFSKRYVSVVDLKEDSWLYCPWLKREELAPKQSVDMSRYVDNYYDSFNIFLFNNEILEIAEELQIPLKAVKELFIREAAEYQEHLDRLRLYIYDKYGILENTSDPETSFINFKKYVLKNHVFKMARYVDIDYDFINFLIASLTRSSTNQTSHNKNNKYVIDYNFKSTDIILKNSLLAFLKKVNVKYEVNANTITVKNKPFYMFIVNGLLSDIDFLVRLDNESYKHISSKLFEDNNTVNNVSLTVALQLKHLLLTSKKVACIKENALGGYDVFEIQDDFKNIDSTLIVSDDGYYTKIKELYAPTNIDTEYHYVKTESSEALFTNCLVRL